MASAATRVATVNTAAFPCTSHCQPGQAGAAPGSQNTEVCCCRQRELQGDGAGNADGSRLAQLLLESPGEQDGGGSDCPGETGTPGKGLRALGGGEE